LATLNAVDHGNRALQMTTDAGAMVRVPATYLDAGHLTHGYAMTVHKAQGATADRALLLGNDDLYLELGYVGLSRGRTANTLYVVAGEGDPDPERGSATLAPDPNAGLRRALSISHAQHLAIDHPRRPDLRSLLLERTRLRAVV